MPSIAREGPDALASPLPSLLLSAPPTPGFPPAPPVASVRAKKGGVGLPGPLGQCLWHFKVKAAAEIS